ncbi:MAG: FixH family protein [Armatimonadetes bacterium]|nr:FixH family protein [Armatimonadota bacterium]
MRRKLFCGWKFLTVVMLLVPVGATACRCEYVRRQAYLSISRSNPMPINEGMKDLTVIKPKRMIKVTDHENWKAMEGFGAQSGQIDMMYEMMVEGSGMQHMKMGKMSLASAAYGKESSKPLIKAGEPPILPVAAVITPNPPAVGDNQVEIQVHDFNGKPVTGLNLEATVAMTTMDMGTAHPRVKELGSGKYQVKVSFGMAGPWRVTLSGDVPHKSEVGSVNGNLVFTAGSKKRWVQPEEVFPMVEFAKLPVRMGHNPVEVKLVDSAAKPVKGAKLECAVSMITMDMGTSHPAIKETKDGLYAGVLNFSMAGDWEVSLKISAPQLRKPFVQSYTVKVENGST